MNKQNNLSEIKAEMLLNYLYPELETQWIAKHKGTFSRNYCEDSLSVNEAEAKVSLSRNGFLNLLPQGLITVNDELKNGDFQEKYAGLKKRERLLKEAFLPFDTFAFRRHLHIEHIFSDLLDDKLRYLLKQYFHYDIDAETNRYVEKTAVLLPYVNRLRGNFGFIRNLLIALIGCEVEMISGRYSQTDNTRHWLPRVKYHLLVHDLTAREYQKLTTEISPLCQFINEWFIPFEMKCDILIKDYQPSVLNEQLTLNYNTILNK